MIADKIAIQIVGIVVALAMYGTVVFFWWRLGK